MSFLNLPLLTYVAQISPRPLLLIAGDKAHSRYFSEDAYKATEVVLHARCRERAAAIDDLAPRSAGVVMGDLSRAVETRSVADQVNTMGRMDAVIHNAGAYSTKGRLPTPEGHPTITAVNILAPYVLTALIERPRRLAYLSSGMHRRLDRRVAVLTSGRRSARIVQRRGRSGHATCSSHRRHDSSRRSRRRLSKRRFHPPASYLGPIRRFATGHRWGWEQSSFT